MYSLVVDCVLQIYRKNINFLFIRASTSLQKLGIQFSTVRRDASGSFSSTVVVIWLLLLLLLLLRRAAMPLRYHFCKAMECCNRISVNGVWFFCRSHCFRSHNIQSSWVVVVIYTLYTPRYILKVCCRLIFDVYTILSYACNACLCDWKIDRKCDTYNTLPAVLIYRNGDGSHKN